jgi:DNA-binding transcriptional LysR family regulator
MDIRSLRYLVAVADAGSFRGAAARIGVSQPAVSQAVALLEDELGERLFDRLGRSVEPTPAARLLLDPARRLLAEFDALPARLDLERGTVRGRLELGTTDVASIYVLPSVYRAFRRRHPEVELSVRVEGTGSLLAQVADGGIEVAVITLEAGGRRADLPGPEFVAEPLFREELAFFVSSRHGLAKARRVSIEDLAAVPLITFKAESITRRAVDGVFTDAGLVPRIAMEMSSPEAIKKLVAVGLGAGILPPRSVAAEVRAGSLRPLPVRGLKLPRILGVVRDGRRTPSPAAQAFLALAERIRNVPAEGGSAPPA